MSIQVCIRAYLSSGNFSDRWYKLNTEPQREDFMTVAFKRDWEVVDHEGFGINLDLPGSQEGIVALSRCVERYGEAFALYASAVGQAYLTIGEDGECEDMDDAYRGSYPSKNGFAEELIEEGSFPSKKELANYVDVERLARDCDLDGSFDEEGEMTKSQMEAKVEEWIEEGLLAEKTLRDYIDVDYATRELEHDYYIIQGDQGWHVFDRNSGGGYRKNPGSSFKLGKFRVGLRMKSDDSEIARSVLVISAPNERSAIGKWNHQYGKHVFDGPVQQTYVFCEKISSLDMRYKDNPGQRPTRKGGRAAGLPWFMGNYVSFQVPQDIVDSIPRSGSADAAVSDAFNDRRVAKIFAGLDRKEIIKELAQYGAWEQSELNDMGPQELEEKMLWIACGHIKEEERQ